MLLIITIGLFLVSVDGIHSKPFNTTWTKKRIINEDYYMNYDYGTTTNDTSDKFELRSDNLILPNPESLDLRYPIDILPDVELPDDSLADTDLKDHDFIDNLMYVYYGSQNRNRNSYSPEIIIVGSIFCCVSQLLTMFRILLLKNANSDNEEYLQYDIYKLFFNVVGSFSCCNVFFMLGVFATKSYLKCQLVAIFLQYFHLLIATWIFLYGYCIFAKTYGKNSLNINIIYVLAYGSPIIWTSLSFVLSPESYETKKFCFMSVEKGMILSYMIPIALLQILTAFYCLRGIRKINMELPKLEIKCSVDTLNSLKNDFVEVGMKHEDDKIMSLQKHKKCLRVVCIMQIFYDLIWFSEVIALENSNNNTPAIMFSTSSFILSFYIFIKTRTLIPIDDYQEKTGMTQFQETKTDELKGQNSSDASTTNCGKNGSSDNIPLLLNSESCTELRELRLDYISTISN